MISHRKKQSLRSFLSVCTVLSGLISLPAFCENFGDLCKKIPKATFPKEDYASREEEKGMGKCDAFDLLHGFSLEADVAKARKCALLHITKRAQPPEFTDFDSATLVEIYGNGAGVKKNPSLALSVLCHIGGFGQGDQLESIFRDLRSTTSPQIEVCINTGGGPLQSECESYAAKKKKKDAGLKASTHTKTCSFSLEQTTHGAKVTQLLRLDDKRCVAAIYEVGGPDPDEIEPGTSLGRFSAMILSKALKTSKITEGAILPGACSEGNGTLNAFAAPKGGTIYELTGTEQPCFEGNATSAFQVKFRIENGEFSVISASEH